jgi:hypothetical protein
MLENVLPENWAEVVFSWYSDCEVADAILDAVFSDTS